MRAARERLQQQRERDRARDKTRRMLIVSACVVAALGVAGGLGVVIAGMDDDPEPGSGPVAAPAGAKGEGKLTIPVGAPDAPATLTVFEDFRCPACRAFENGYRETVHRLQDKGLLRTEYHLATIIDGNMGGQGSQRAANAAACAQDSGKFAEYHDVLFKNQPQETDDAYARNDRLIELARKVDGLDTPAFRSCVEDGAHDSWVAKSQEAFSKSGHRGTPTVLLNGKDVYNNPQKPLTPARLQKLVEASAKRS